MLILLLKYACLVWSTSLMTSQNVKIEDVQIRAFRIVLGTIDLLYESVLEHLKLETLKCMRETLAKSIFIKFLLSNSRLHDLLPVNCNRTIISQLRKPNKYALLALIHFRESLIQWELLHWQH